MKRKEWLFWAVIATAVVANILSTFWSFSDLAAVKIITFATLFVVIILYEERKDGR